MCRIIGRELTRRPPVKRYALQSLIDAVGLSEAETARRIGLSGSTLKRAREVGFTETAADRYACRAGFVPWMVWPEWIDDVVADVSVECADEKCAVMFVPTNARQRFCSQRCASRNRKRRQYQTDAEFREKERARQATYKAATRRAANLYAAAYRRANADMLAEKRRRERAANRDAINARRRALYASKRAAA